MVYPKQQRNIATTKKKKKLWELCVWMGRDGCDCGYCIEGGMEFKDIVIWLYSEATHEFRTNSNNNKFQY